MSGDVAIDAWLVEQGYGLPASKAKAHAAIEEAGLTRAGKLRISAEKLPRVLEALRARFCLHCTTAECIGFAKGSGREPLQCDPKSACERCGGSNNRRAEADLIEACAKDSCGADLNNATATVEQGGSIVSTSRRILLALILAWLARNRGRGQGRSIARLQFRLQGVGTRDSKRGRCAGI